MSEDSAQDKSEKATPRKRSKALKKGQIAQSREIPSVMILLTSLGVFYFAGAWMFGRMTTIVHATLNGGMTASIDSVSSTTRLLAWCFHNFLQILLPLILPVLIVGIAANVSQFGFIIKEDFLKLDLQKVFSMKGLKRLVSLRSLVEVVKSLLKLTFVGLVAYFIVKKELIEIPSLIQLDVMDIMTYLTDICFRIIFFVCLALIVLAAADFGYQKWQHEKDLRMTKQEVREERKQAEGDPKVKARIRKVQMEMAMKRMMEMIPEADVVITNPTHYAVALRFEPKEMDAPTVVAKGADHMAARIRERARECDVPIVENKSLARSLYKVTEIGDAVPVDLYKAVAEVLAYVYRLKGVKNPV